MVNVVGCSFPVPADVGPDGGDDDGTGADAALAIDQTPHDFGAVDVGTRSSPLTIMVTNEGEGPTGAIEVEVVGANSEDFEVMVDGCERSPLDADASCAVEVAFAPKGGGAREGRLTIAATPGGLVAVDLTGTGVSDCVSNTTTCEDDRYVECDADGHVAFEMQCPLGCASASVKCLDIDPSNSLGPYLDMSVDGPDVVMGDLMIDTTTGVVSNQAGGAVEIPNGLFVQQDTSIGIRVYWVRSLSITGTVRVTGNAAVAFVSNGDVTITGTLDVAAKGKEKGPGQRGAVDACTAPSVPSSTDAKTGAGGAGHSGAGATGGKSTSGTTGGAAGTFVTGDDLVPLLGGCKGGSVYSSSGGIATGGGGGGSAQIVSRTAIRLSSTGKIDASGGGGTGGLAIGPTLGGGGGGGSGGSILLEAPEVLLDGMSVVLSTKGGAGGSAADYTANGADGGTSPYRAQGGSSGSYAKGGNGGTLGVPPTAGGNGNASHPAGAGGGGAVGRTRINTATGVCSPQNGAAIRSSSTVDTIVKREVPGPTP